MEEPWRWRRDRLGHVSVNNHIATHRGIPPWGAPSLCPENVSERLSLHTLTRVGIPPESPSACRTEAGRAMYALDHRPRWQAPTRVVTNPLWKFPRDTTGTCTYKGSDLQHREPGNFPVMDLSPTTAHDLQFLPDRITFGKCCSHNLPLSRLNLSLLGSTPDTGTFRELSAHRRMSGRKLAAHLREPKPQLGSGG